jgi:hypothetical protein
VRRRLGELALESVSPKRGIGETFERGRARTIAAQREDERQMLDRNRDVCMARKASPARKSATGSLTLRPNGNLGRWIIL